MTRLGSRARVRCQAPITLPNDTEPQPDISIVRADLRWYVDHHPYVDDVFLAIEIADTTRYADADVKIPLYGRLGVKEAWLVDLLDRLVRVYREPRASEYGVTSIAYAGESVAALAFPTERFSVDDMLPPSSSR
jgi:Uma2 family endonuclease